MKVFISAILVLICLVSVADAQRKTKPADRSKTPIGSGQMSTTQRYYGANGRQVLTERKYPDRSYFYSGKTGLPVGQKVNSRK